MKYSIEKLTLAQIPTKQIDKELLQQLEQRASYVDTDKGLGEVLVSTDCLLNIESEVLELGNVRLASLAIEMYKQVKKYNYVQIAKI